MCEDAQANRPGTKLSQIPMFEARQVVDGLRHRAGLRQHGGRCGPSSRRRSWI